MFITLLGVTFAIALVVTTIVAKVFQKSITGILGRIFIPEIAAAWQRYMSFASWRSWPTESPARPGRVASR